MQLWGDSIPGQGSSRTEPVCATVWEFQIKRHLPFVGISWVENGGMPPTWKFPFAQSSIPVPLTVGACVCASVWWELIMQAYHGDSFSHSLSLHLFFILSVCGFNLWARARAFRLSLYLSPWPPIPPDRYVCPAYWWSCLPRPSLVAAGLKTLFCLFLLFLPLLPCLHFRVISLGQQKSMIGGRVKSEQECTLNIKLVLSDSQVFFYYTFNWFRSAVFSFATLER